MTELSYEERQRIKQIDSIKAKDIDYKLVNDLMVKHDRSFTLVNNYLKQNSDILADKVLDLFDKSGVTKDLEIARKESALALDTLEFVNQHRQSAFLYVKWEMEADAIRSTKTEANYDEMEPIESIDSMINRYVIEVRSDLNEKMISGFYNSLVNLCGNNELLLQDTVRTEYAETISLIKANLSKDSYNPNESLECAALLLECEDLIKQKTLESTSK